MHFHHSALLPFIIRPRHSCSAAAYSRQTSRGRSVGPYVRTVYVRMCVRPSVCPVHCDKTADRIRMPFGIVGRTGPGMRQGALKMWEWKMQEWKKQER